MKNPRSKELNDRLIRFSVQCSLLLQKLERDAFGNMIIDQVTRAAGSAALNYAEAIAAESIKDFVHKLSLCLKELRESLQGLQMILEYLQLKSKDVTDFRKLWEECNELVSIFVSSINTTRKKYPKFFKSRF